jgi:hypothetical protein
MLCHHDVGRIGRIIRRPSMAEPVPLFLTQFYNYIRVSSSSFRFGSKQSIQGPHHHLGMATKDESSKEQKVSYMSLSNKGQLALCCLARSAEPIAMASIQVRGTGVLFLNSDINKHEVVHVLPTQIFRSFGI